MGKLGWGCFGRNSMATAKKQWWSLGAVVRCVAPFVAKVCECPCFKAPRHLPMLAGACCYVLLHAVVHVTQGAVPPGHREPPAHAQSVRRPEASSGNRWYGRAQCITSHFAR